MSVATYSDLTDASVFITGGGAGIGAALTAGFVGQGARVAFVGRSDYADFAAALADSGPAPLFIRADVTDTAALHAAMDEAAAAHGPIRVLVNNAANDMRHDSAEVTPEIWDAQQAVNLKHYFFACQKAAAGMTKAGGSIINFSSISYMMGAAGYAPYVAANAAITGLTRSLAREWGADGIRINAVAPGWVLTQRQLDTWATPEALENHLARQCLKTHLVPEDVVGMVLFLASRASAMVTSQTLVVDGGVVVTG